MTEMVFHISFVLEIKLNKITMKNPPERCIHTVVIKHISRSLEIITVQLQIFQSCYRPAPCSHWLVRLAITVKNLPEKGVKPTLLKGYHTLTVTVH